MKTTSWILLLSLGLCLSLLMTAWTSRPIDFRQVENLTFNKGEFINLKIHYGLINAGFCTLEVKPETVKVNGRDCYHIVGKGYSNAAFDLFYKVRDRYESYFDTTALLSWKFTRYIEEGKFIAYSETHFDQLRQKARYIDRRKQTKFYETSENIQDVLSAYYYARTVYNPDDLKVGDRISLKNFIDRKTVNLEAELLAREVLKVNGVYYKTLKLKLTVEESGLITDGSKITLWISDDQNKIPIRMKSDLMIGSVKADLLTYKNLRHPFTAKIDK